MLLKSHYKLLILIFFFTSCSVKKHIQRYTVEGYVVDENSIPIDNVSITFILDKDQRDIMIISAKDSTITNNKGFYKFKEVSTKEIGFMGGEAIKKLPVSYQFKVEKKGFINDTINIYYITPINNILHVDKIKLNPK